MHKRIVNILFCTITVVAMAISVWMVWPVEVNAEPPEGITCTSEVTSRYRSWFSWDGFGWYDLKTCSTAWGEVGWTLED